MKKKKANINGYIFVKHSKWQDYSDGCLVLEVVEEVTIKREHEGLSLWCWTAVHLDWGGYMNLSM